MDHFSPFVPLLTHLGALLDVMMSENGNEDILFHDIINFQLANERVRLTELFVINTKLIIIVN